MTAWQLIFSQSKVNNRSYDEDRLVAQNWGLAQRDLVSETVEISPERSSQKLQSIEAA
jgi:hypothetical protein